MGTKDLHNGSKLRQRAEDKLKEFTVDSEDLSGESPEKMATLIHELQVHQIELQMQNDELRRIQGELEKTRDKFSHLYDFAPVGYFSVSEKGIIEEINLTGASLVGQNRSVLIGKPFTKFILRDDQDIFYKHRQRLLESNTSQICELRLMRQDHIFHASLTCMVVKNIGSDVRRIRLVVSDISERKRLEEELIKTQKIESVGILAGGIAHDFNNILASILGNISLAKHGLTPEDEIFDLLSEAEAASNRAQALTKRLLTFSQGGGLVKKTASLKDIIKESCAFMLSGSKSRSVLSIPKDLWQAEIDVGQMSQVINNIIINANQAMADGGIIQVLAENINLDDTHGIPLVPGKFIRISIKDQGVGIVPKDIAKIFDPYFTTKPNGNGLGLAMAFAIIMKHEGHITVNSKLGEGTTLHLYLPASDKISFEKEKSQLIFIKGQGRILVMDDEEQLRILIGRMLEKLGYEPDLARDGVEALALYKAAMNSEKPYDAVILDLTIPGGMGGRETMDRLREIDPEIKAIVSSGYSIDPILAKYHEYGFKGMIAKPFEYHLLSKILNEVLQR